VVFGDTASLPAINSLLEAIGEIPARVWLEWQHDSDRSLPVRSGPNTEITWLERINYGQLLRQEAEARALLHELGTPTESNWSRLARERSIDTATQMRSGSLGYVAADGQTHLPQVRVATTLFAAADRVRDGQLVPEPVVEGAAFAVVWRRGSRAAASSQLAAVSVDIGAVLVQERFANETHALIERLRQDSVRDYQPALLAGFEPRSLDVREPASPVAPAALAARPVVLSPRASDTGLR